MKFDDKQYLAKQIKEHRKKMGLTQLELAEKVNLSDQHISRIEAGQYIPSLKSFFQLIDVLNIDLSLFGVNVKLTENKRKNKLIEMIAKANDSELIFYENLIEAANSSLSRLKKELLYSFM